MGSTGGSTGVFSCPASPEAASNSTQIEPANFFMIASLFCFREPSEPQGFTWDFDASGRCSEVSRRLPACGRREPAPADRYWVRPHTAKVGERKPAGHLLCSSQLFAGAPGMFGSSSAADQRRLSNTPGYR